MKLNAAVTQDSRDAEESPTEMFHLVGNLIPEGQQVASIHPGTNVVQVIVLECEDESDQYERAVALIPSDCFPEALMELRIAFADLALVADAERGNLLNGIRDLLEFKNLRNQVQDTFACRSLSASFGNLLQQP